MAKQTEKKSKGWLIGIIVLVVVSCALLVLLSIGARRLANLTPRQVGLGEVGFIVEAGLSDTPFKDILDMAAVLTEDEEEVIKETVTNEVDHDTAKSDAALADSSIATDKGIDYGALLDHEAQYSTAKTITYADHQLGAIFDVVIKSGNVPADTQALLKRFSISILQTSLIMEGGRITLDTVFLADLTSVQGQGGMGLVVPKSVVVTVRSHLNHSGGKLNYLDDYTVIINGNEEKSGALFDVVAAALSTTASSLRSEINRGITACFCTVVNNIGTVERVETGSVTVTTHTR